MQIREYGKGKVILVIAEKGKYLALKGIENSEELIGKPIRITLEQPGIIPEFEEREVEE